MSAEHVIKNCPSIASTRNGWRRGHRPSTIPELYVCSVRQKTRPAGGRSKQTKVNTRVVSAGKRCHEPTTAKMASRAQMQSHVKSVVERRSCWRESWNKRESTALALAEDSSSYTTNSQHKCSCAGILKSGSAKNVSSPNVSCATCPARQQCPSDQKRRKLWPKQRRTSATGSANGACILHVPDAALNTKGATKPTKGSSFSFIYGFAALARTRAQRRQSSNIRLAAVAVPRKNSHCRSLGTLTEHGAAQHAGAMQTASVPLSAQILC